MNADELTAVVADLVERVKKLETGAGAPARPPVVDATLVQSLIDRLSPGDSGERNDRQGTVVYAGAGPSDDGMIAWQMSRSWSELIVVDPTTVAACFAALASSVRIQIICELASGSVTTGELTQRLDQPSSGQLFHHLKELLAVGLIYQPVRGTYAILHQHLVPILTALSCASDLARTAPPSEPS
jgi:DNA-binding transcriptional ArsR family regulator